MSQKPCSIDFYILALNDKWHRSLCLKYHTVSSNSSTLTPVVRLCDRSSPNSWDQAIPKISRDAVSQRPCHRRHRCSAARSAEHCSCLQAATLIRKHICRCITGPTGFSSVTDTWMREQHSRVMDCPTACIANQKPAKLSCPWQVHVKGTAETRSLYKTRYRNVYFYDSVTY